MNQNQTIQLSREVGDDLRMQYKTFEHHWQSYEYLREKNVEMQQNLFHENWIATRDELQAALELHREALMLQATILLERNKRELALEDNEVDFLNRCKTISEREIELAELTKTQQSREVSHER